MKNIRVYRDVIGYDKGAVLIVDKEQRKVLDFWEPGSINHKSVGFMWQQFKGNERSFETYRLDSAERIFECDTIEEVWDWIIETYTVDLL